MRLYYLSKTQWACMRGRQFALDYTGHVQFDANILLAFIGDTKFPTIRMAMRI